MAITNTAGAVIERLAYDPWGKRRFITGATDTLDAITGVNIDRGFTMHEHIDEMGIINMNGRIYDPLIGRFMSADPYIQAPDDLQSHNRYAYVMNNPLNLDDPTGYWSISKLWKKVWKNPIFKVLVGIAVAVYAPQLLATIFSSTAAMGVGSLANVIATGALSGFASTGTLKGALTGAFTAGIMFGVGEIAAGLDLAKAGTEGVTAGSMMGRTALHAGAGCLSSMVGGGSCKAGAISGALGELGTHMPGSDNYAFGVAKGAMMGGIGAKLAGGKFADGAQTGEFGYMFNAALEHGKGDLLKTKNKLDKISDFLDIRKNYEEGYELGKVDKQLALKDDSIRQERVDKNPGDAQRQESAKGYKTFSTGMAGPASMALEHFSIKNPIATIPKVKGYYDGYTGN